MDSQALHFILLRGLARESAHWGKFPQLLKARWPTAKITGVDLPGSGMHYREKAPLSISQMVRRVRSDFRRVQSVEPERLPILVTMSLGGMVAVEWMQNFPEDINKAVLINTSFRGWSPVLKRLKPEALKLLFSAVMASNLRERERKVLQLVSNRPELYDQVSREWEKIQAIRPMSKGNFFRQLFAAARFSVRGEAPKTPILLLNSATDRMVDPSCTAVIHQRWRLPWYCHQTAGHDLVLDDGDWVIQHLSDWL